MYSQVTAGLVYTTRDTTRATASIITAQPGVHHTRHRRCFNHHSAALVYTTRATACSVALVYTTRATACSAALVYTTCVTACSSACGVHQLQLRCKQHWCTPHASLPQAMQCCWNAAESFKWIINLVAITYDATQA